MRPAADIATASQLEITSLSDTPETDNRTRWVCNCSLTACLRYPPRLGAFDDQARSGLVGVHPTSSRGRIATILQYRGSPRSHPRNTRMSISFGRNKATTLLLPCAYTDAAYAFERIASAKVTIRPRPSSHSA